MNVLEKFCEGKTIAIVGNSSRLLNSKLGNIIDSHDIVIRINHAPRYMSKYKDNVGTKTTIMSYGMSSLGLASNISKICNPQFNLFLVRCNGEIKDYKQYENFKNPYHGKIQEYAELHSIFKPSKPSTGAVTVNFFVKNINFSKLNLFGFDFFTGASNSRKNEFGSYYYKDHNSDKEKVFINSVLNDKVSIYY